MPTHGQSPTAGPPTPTHGPYVDEVDDVYCVDDATSTRARQVILSASWITARLPLQAHAYSSKREILFQGS